MLALFRFLFKSTIVILGTLAVVFVFAAMQTDWPVQSAPPSLTPALGSWGTGPKLFTVFPGWRLEQVADSLAINGIMDGQSFRRVAEQGTVLSHSLLQDRPANKSYEGYLFPGIYHLSPSPTPEELISQMLAHMADQLPPNAGELARNQGLTFFEALTLASIVEREAVLDSERPLIASVYLNRLQNKGGHRYLQADPTVQYALGYQSATGQWWKAPISLSEYAEVKDPYNTYLNPGLPPGPISNPSIKSILAVLYPAQTDYLYFVCSQPDCEGGRHTFAETYDEHLRNVAVYYDQ
jgi:UPF0755 protein